MTDYRCAARDLLSRPEVRRGLWNSYDGSSKGAFDRAVEVVALEMGRVAQAERERCAQVADRWERNCILGNHKPGASIAHNVAINIRALTPSETIPMSAQIAEPSKEAIETHVPSYVAGVEVGHRNAAHRDRSELTALIEKARAAYAAMSPEEREAHDIAQRESWVRGNIELDRLERQTTSMSAQTGGDAGEGAPRHDDCLPDCMMPDGADPCLGYQALLADRDRWKADNRRLGTALMNLNEGLAQLQTITHERDEARAALRDRERAGWIAAREAAAQIADGGVALVDVRPRRIKFVSPEQYAADLARDIADGIRALLPPGDTK